CRRGERRERDEDRLPSDQEDVGQGRGNFAALDPIGSPAEHHRWGRAALAGQGDQADQQERKNGTHEARDRRLPEGDAEAQEERSVADAKDRDVRGAPWPEQVAWAALALPR